MAEITVDLIKELRDRTGIGMGACKQALVEAQGDIETAITNLRKAGMASAVKKEGRATNEGQVGVFESPDCIALVEVNAETDFVVKNDRFQQFLTHVAEQVAHTKPESLEDFLKQPYSKEKGMTVDEYRASIVQTIGENIQIRRLSIYPKKANHSYGIYSHLGGKICVVVALDGASNEEKVAKDVAMHIAAASPLYLNAEDVPDSVIEHEKEIVRSQIANKPDSVKEKIISGKIQAYCKENCLVDQPFIRDDKLTVAQYVAAKGKESGNDLKVVSFIRWDVGQ